MASGIPDADVEIVANRTSRDKTTARRALQRVDGDLAAAVELIENGSLDDATDDPSFRERVEEIRLRREMSTIPDADVEIVANRTEGDETTARRALHRADGDLAGAVRLIENGEVTEPTDESPGREPVDADDARDDERSFRERVEEIRRQRADERGDGTAASTAAEATNSDDAADDERSFRERVEEIRRRRGQKRQISQSDSSDAVKTDRERRPPDEVPSAPDVSIDRSELRDERPIGAGGNADVSRATLPTGRGSVDLAVKEPRLVGTVRREEIEELLDEAETWAKLDDHDGVVDVVDWGADPFPWIALEYMDGGHLGERVGEMGTLQSLWTAVTVTEAVYHAHRRGVAHLDLKPTNVLFREIEGAWDVPKVADWGLSKRLLERSQSVEGLSPQYAAPEQFDDEYGRADDLTDVYQLGAVFYDLFTGRPPFVGRPAEVMHDVLGTSPTPPSERAAVPAKLDEILLKALAKEKEDRYDDIVYFRDDLRTLYRER